MPQILLMRRICGGSLSDNLLARDRDVFLVYAPERGLKRGSSE